MEEARESISHTVEEIKDTVEDQYESVKETVSGVLDYREQFQKDPIVWSVGALVSRLRSRLHSRLRTQGYEARRAQAL